MPGRPSTYSAAIASAICERIADGESLRAICRDEAMPDRATVRRWVDANAEFAAKYARARILQADAVDEEMVDLTDQVKAGTLDPAAARVVLANMQWRAAKLAPKVYGDKTILAGDPENPVAISEIRRTVVDPK